MPTYDYQCEKCGKTFEVFHGMSETPTVRCKKRGCTGQPRKLIGAGSGLIFKGSGFYITDYKNAKSGNGKGAEAKAESSPESKSESKSEAKAAPKSESKAAPKAEASSGTKGGGGCCGSC